MDGGNLFGNDYTIYERFVQVYEIRNRKLKKEKSSEHIKNDAV